MSRGTRRDAGLGGLLVGLALVLSACVRMPAEGPVVVHEAPDSASRPPGIYFDPQPPRPGQSASEVVAGFLEAMKAMPIRTSVAAEFLTEDERTRWSPESATWTYSEAEPAQGELEVRLPLKEVNRYRGNGAWAGRVAHRELVFDLTVEKGEWRIDEVPDALIVPESWFADWYQRASLYFFDPSFRTLVPEPVYLPTGDQLATSLVRDLLDPRGRTSRAVTRTAFPATLDAPLAVPVSDAGVADVRLEGEQVVDDLTTQRMLAQLAWTLRQDPSQRALQLSIGDTPLPLPGGTPEVGLGIGSRFDPAGELASSAVFGLRRGRLVRGPLTGLEATTGPFGSQQLGVRSIGISIDGGTVAGVSGQGRAVIMGPVDDPDGTAVEVLSGAVNLLQPAWDVHDTVWLLDRNRGSARIRAVTGRRPARPVFVPGISGRDVTRFLVSRDGTRLVAVVRRPGGDQVLSARLVRDGRGTVVQATRAIRIGGPSEPTRVQDIGWRSPTSVSILSRITDDLAQVRTVPVEGAPGDLVTVGTSRIRGHALELLTSPVEGQGAYVVTGDRVSDLALPGQEASEVGASLRSLVFVG